MSTKNPKGEELFAEAPPQALGPFSNGEFNPWALPRPEQVEETFVLTDRPSGYSLTFTLRSMDPIQAAMVGEEARKLIEVFVGSEYSGEEPIEFLGPDGEEYKLSLIIIQELCTLRNMELPSKRKSFVWWVGIFTRMPDLYAQLSVRATKLNNHGLESAEKKQQRLKEAIASI